MGNGNLSKKRGFLSEITSDALDYISGKLEALIPSKMSQLENDGDFVSDAQYVHTDNNYTDAEQEKLAGIEAGAEVNTVKSVCGKTGAVALGKEDVGLGNVDNTADLEKPVSAAMQAALSVKADKQNEYGGFAAGDRSESTEGGGAIGYDTYAFAGGAVGHNAKVTNAGGAVGADSEAGNGGAVGEGAKTSSGFAGGAGAQAVSADGAGIDAIQLGTGTNSTPKTLQVYSYQLMDADGNIPSARIPQLAEKADKTELIGKAGTGEGAEVFNDYANNEAAKTYAHAEGFMTKAYGLHSHAEGSLTITGNPEVTTANSSGDYAHAEGYLTKATGTQGCHVEGYETTSSGGSTHAEGFRTTASGMYGAHTEGRDSTASGDSAHAEGYGTQANGDNSHAEGYGSKAITDNAHAEGEYTNANGVGSHAEGAYTHATGDSSHTEGYTTTASASCAHAEGWESIASGVSAHAEGYGTTAASESQHVQGKYNIEDSDGVYAHIVGNGTSDTNRSNAHTLDWDGNAWFAGKVTVGADAEELAAKSDLDAKADKQNASGGFSAGAGGFGAVRGAAIGYGTEAYDGAAVGDAAVAGNGFSGGNSARVALDQHATYIDAIQLGTGTNSVPKSLQVYSHTVMNADGSLPYVHTARPYVEETLPEVLALNTIYDLGTQTSVTLKLPSANVGNFIQVDFLCGDTPATFTIDAASSAIVSDYDFTPEPDKAYSLFFDYGRLAGSLYGWRFSYAEYTYTEV